MTVIDVRTVERNDVVHFLFNGFSDSFDTKNLEDFTDIVGGRSDRIDIFLAENFHQTISISFQNPFGKMFELSVRVDDDTFLLVFGGPMHVDLGDSFNTL